MKWVQCITFGHYRIHRFVIAKRVIGCVLWHLLILSNKVDLHTVFAVCVAMHNFA